MGEMIHLTASDGVKISAYRSAPAGAPKGGIVVIQEIFGVNHHIRAVADLYAAQGYLAIAPATFDRAQIGVEFEYNAEGVAKGIELVGKIPADKSMLDIEAAIVQATLAGKVGVVGYCWGGTMAFVSACHLAHVAAAVGYYGGGIAARMNETPKAPLMLHFGAKDAHIPLSGVEAFQAAHPGVPVHVYDSDHGFNCDERGSYDKASADLARERTLAFFAEHVG